MVLRIKATLPYEGPFFPRDIVTCLITITLDAAGPLEDPPEAHEPQGEPSATGRLWKWVFPARQTPQDGNDPQGRRNSMLAAFDNSSESLQGPGTAGASQNVLLASSVSLAESAVPPEAPPENAPRRTADLLWGSAQFVGYYALDPALVDTAALAPLQTQVAFRVAGFEHLWGDQAGAGGGGLTTAEPRISLEKGAAQGTMPRRAVFPVLAMPASILFTDVQLDSETCPSRTFVYQLALPSRLPGTYPGRSISVAYTLCIGVQRGSAVAPTLVVNVPVRVFPRPALHRAPASRPQGELDLLQPRILTQSPAHTAALPPGAAAVFAGETSDARTGVVQPLRAFKASSLRGTLRNLARINRHLSPSAGISLNTPLATAGLCFDIARNEEPLARIRLARNAFRLGETIHCVVDLAGAAVPCYHLSVTLESFETVAPELARQPKAVVARKSRRVWGAFHGYTAHAQRVPVQIPIPTTRWGAGISTAHGGALTRSSTAGQAAANRLTLDLRPDAGFPASASAEPLASPVSPAAAAAAPSRNAMLYAVHGFSPDFASTVVSVQFVLRFTFVAATAGASNGHKSGSSSRVSSQLSLSSAAPKVKVTRPPADGRLARDAGPQAPAPRHDAFPSPTELEAAFAAGSTATTPAGPTPTASTSSLAWDGSLAQPASLDAGAHVTASAQLPETVAVDEFDCTVPIRIAGWADDMESLVEAAKDPNFFVSHANRADAGESGGRLRVETAANDSENRRASVLVSRNASPDTSLQSHHRDWLASALQLDLDDDDAANGAPGDDPRLAREHDDAASVSSTLSTLSESSHLSDSLGADARKDLRFGSDNIFGAVCADEISFWQRYADRYDADPLGGQQFEFLL